MSNSFQSAFQFGGSASARPIEPESPMRILVMGNFSGRTTDEALSDRKFFRVDVDNFDELLEKLAPTARIRLGDSQGTEIEIKIRELDDFEPDALYRNVALFEELRGLRKRLMDPSSFAAAVVAVHVRAGVRQRQIAAEVFAAAVAELGQAISIAPEKDSVDEAPQKTTSETPSGSSPSKESDADMLERVLGQTAKSVDSSPGGSPKVDIQGLINEIVAPYIEPKPDPRQDEYVQHADAAIAGQMRSILHHPAFQNLEATWLGLKLLVNEVTHSGEVQVFVWDVTKTELLQAGESENDELEDSLLFRKLVIDREQIPFSMLVANDSFSHDLNDLILLTRLGAIGANTGGPLLAPASPQLMGCDDWTDEISTRGPEPTLAEENWNSIRTSPVAAWIALSGPNVMLRLPYGAKTHPIDAFDFEEIDDPIADHESLLWGPSSLLVATLLATSFLESGWSMSPGDHREMGDLPALTYQDDGETHLKACAERFISERDAERILDRGIMPLLSFKDRNAVRVLRIQSIASPPTSLKGNWS